MPLSTLTLLKAGPEISKVTYARMARPTERIRYRVPYYTEILRCHMRNGPPTVCWASRLALTVHFSGPLHFLICKALFLRRLLAVRCTKHYSLGLFSSRLVRLATIPFTYNHGGSCSRASARLQVRSETARGCVRGLFEGTGPVRPRPSFSAQNTEKNAKHPQSGMVFQERSHWFSCSSQSWALQVHPTLLRQNCERCFRPRRAVRRGLLLFSRRRLGERVAMLFPRSAALLVALFPRFLFLAFF
jgi:hypothetical protein